MEDKIETARLVLRRARRSDGEDYWRLRSSEYVLRFNALEPVSRRRALEQLLEDRDSPRAFYLEERATGRLAGAVWLARDCLRAGVDALSLEYFLGEAFAGRGLMTEALGALLPYAFHVLGARVISARAAAGNTASQRVLEKLGFSREGALRRAVKGHGGQVYDDVPFSLLREEWEGAIRRKGDEPFGEPGEPHR